MSKISRRELIIGGSAAAVASAVAAVLVVTRGDNGDGEPSDVTEVGVDPTSWFADGESVAALGGTALGITIAGDCASPNGTFPTTAAEFATAVAAEEKCGEMQQLGNWFLTPTEVRAAQLVHKYNS